MDRVFLDANVLFSAAYAPGNSFLALWKRKGIRLLTSDYAGLEALRNLSTVEQRERFEKLFLAVENVPSRMDRLSCDVPADASLPEKDRPILSAAIAARATHLLTGDRRHFGTYYGKRIGGALIQTPAQYLSCKIRSTKRK